MARTSFYPQNNFERLLCWFILASLSWGLLLGLIAGARWLWGYLIG
jgi:hypothetical protein